ncbi:MAG: class I SAM-dependent methyltransferase [Xenococcaceae cyanobacterium MO_188.B32]|nr:class I SAM-dependent methyltransferase [Xenococcaceae cyanobacterium MO_188.B32]
MKIPTPVNDVINGFYQDYLKTDQDGNQRNMRLGSGCPRMEECFILAELYLQKKPQHSLDFGLGEGTACITLAACRKHLNLEGKHTTLDPFQFNLAKGIGLNEIHKYNLQEYVDFLEDKSEEFLYHQYKKNNQYDFVFVDGAHDIGHKVVDAFWIDRILQPGGIVAFHDSLFFSTSVAIRYLAENQQYDLLKLNIDPNWKVWGRTVKHSSRLGPQFCFKYVPKMGKSITALRKPLTPN